MNRLEELIAELCPDGVEFKRLGKCCHLEKGSTPIQKAIPGEYPLVVTTEERKSSNTYQFDAPTVCIPLVSSRGHGVASLNQVYYQDGKFALGNILCGVTPIDHLQLSASFLYHYLNYKKDIILVPLMKGGANVSLTVDSLQRVKVPVPPIDVQIKIVSILDSFIALSAELKAELTARKKQYEFYRDKLLSFDILAEGASNCKWQTLGEISTYRRGSFPQPYGNKEWYDGVGAMPFVQVADIGDDMRLVQDTKRKISVVAQPKSVFAPQNSIIISLQGSIGRIAITQYDAYIDRTVAIFQDIAENLLPKYFAYQLQRVFSIKEKTARGSTIKTITKEELFR